MTTHKYASGDTLTAHYVGNSMDFKNVLYISKKGAVFRGEFLVVLTDTGSLLRHEKESTQLQ